MTPAPADWRSVPISRDRHEKSTLAVFLSRFNLSLCPPITTPKPYARRERRLYRYGPDGLVGRKICGPRLNPGVNVGYAVMISRRRASIVRGSQSPRVIVGKAPPTQISDQPTGWPVTTMSFSKCPCCSERGLACCVWGARQWQIMIRSLSMNSHKAAWTGSPRSCWGIRPTAFRPGLQDGPWKEHGITCRILEPSRRYASVLLIYIMPVDLASASTVCQPTAWDTQAF